jgi:hypothetical protein
MFTIALRFIVKYRHAKGCPFETQAVKIAFKLIMCRDAAGDFSWQNVV